MTQNDRTLLEPGWGERWCEVKGASLHLIEAGRPGDPLLMLLHGFPEFWWAWREQITPLAEAGYHVVAPDLRGYNLSAARQEIAAYGLDTLTEDVIGLVNAMGADAFYLVGHDWGSVIGWCVAARYPERVTAAVLLSGPHPQAWVAQMFQNPAQSLRSWYIGFFQLPWLPEKILGAFNFARLKAALRRSALARTFSAQKLERYGQAWVRPGALPRMLAYYRALRRQTGRSPTGRIKPPVQIIWGDKDIFLSRSLMEASLVQCDRGTLSVIKGGTHWLHLEHPECITDAICRFFND